MSHLRISSAMMLIVAAVFILIMISGLGTFAMSAVAAIFILITLMSGSRERSGQRRWFRSDEAGGRSVLSVVGQGSAEGFTVSVLGTVYARFVESSP